MYRVQVYAIFLDSVGPHQPVFRVSRARVTEGDKGRYELWRNAHFTCRKSLEHLPTTLTPSTRQPLVSYHPRKRPLKA